ncbi:MAG: hypothetical protein ACFB0B_21920 [Thermonemataceae bacterium]
MKKILPLLLVLLSVSFHLQAQKERFLRECIEENPKAENMDDIKEFISSDFILFSWAGVLRDQCSATIDKKDPKFLPYISEQRKVVKALLQLYAVCPNDKDFKEVYPYIEEMQAIYDEVEVETESVNKDDGGFGGLFNDEEKTEVSITLKQVRKLRKVATNLRKALK